MFTEKSAIVQLWVRLVSAGAYTMDQVPGLGNLQAMVYDALHEMAEEKEKV